MSIDNPPLVYVAGPYRAKNSWDVEQNIRAAELVAYGVAGTGCMPICPHTNTRGYFESLPWPDRFWLGGTLSLMLRCDAVYMMPTWQLSSGARAERIAALENKMPVFHDLEALRKWAEARP